MGRIIERVAGRYDVREMCWAESTGGVPSAWFLSVIAARGRSLWAPLMGSMTTCACGTDHADAVREGPDAGRSEDETLRPWRYTGGREDAGLPY